MPVATFSERVGTALINGSWFVRKLKPFAERIVVMHGHRHTDWIGPCGGVKIVCPIAGHECERRRADTFLHPYAAAGPNGKLRLLAPEWRSQAQILSWQAADLVSLTLFLGLGSLRSAEEIGEPAAGWMMTAECQDGEGDRNPYECPKHTPQKGPEENREQHKAGG